MLNIRVLVVVALVVGLGAPNLHAEPPADEAAAQASLEALVNSIRANRKAFVAVNLQLSDDEATKFWPVYDRYQKEINAVGDRLVTLIEDYVASFANLSDDKAMGIVRDYLAIEADRVKVKTAYVDEFAKSLPGRKLARFYQIENKMDAVIRYDLASTIPVLEEGTKPQTQPK
jgi:hypothetical protein